MLCMKRAEFWRGALSCIVHCLFDLTYAMDSGKELDRVKGSVLRNVIDTGVEVLRTRWPKTYKRLTPEMDFTSDGMLWIGAIQTISNALSVHDMYRLSTYC